jgi:hypothetical protein
LSPAILHGRRAFETAPFSFGAEKARIIGSSTRIHKIGDELHI